ncbi:NAD(P)(+) transhydrogenase (Re/Si-specific) subunit alpha [Serinibacter arcticus]|uniref:proton-translocating NAD(P)(+) transhydrogenase n=1 Tax=Serinibacter arcticus TaxID=1655435 RepID=A0A2U1ZR36_9MICO|nr:Re/Si-specific NAD(P)(+) transhydrogenase subunit alpha [Serinibacter arcticus]PWD49436.1 NAD(P)(+) transhydrogenase (Re/Si-specific) subunit alpha [Serinibacter arcticus]
MILGVPRATAPGATAVAATPATVVALRRLGYDVLVEAGAGAAAHLTDDAYREAGATVGTTEQAWGADVVALVSAPAPADVERLTPGATFAAMLAPAQRPDLLEALARRRVTALALDAVPRISRAQAFDTLSTQSNIAGYRAVVEAAQAYGGMLAGQVTAAGKTDPATVFVIGAGVAGLAAIGAAGSLGARVRAFDVRPEVAEQIESLGGEFVRAPQAQQEVAADGYATPLTPEQQAAAMDVYAVETARADIVITTALVRGTAPTTITAAMVAAMRPGSIVVDLAASGGGNCEVTVPGSTVVTPGGVTVIGETDLTARMPRHTSQLLGTNVVNLLTLMTPGRDGVLVLDLDDVVVRGLTVTGPDGVLWPPPPVQVSAAPAAPPSPPPLTPAEVAARETAERDERRRRGQRRTVAIALGAVLVAFALTSAPASVLPHLMVFALAVVVGFYVISQVSHSLHTPLMAQTNAISGIILVGALLQLGNESLLVTVLAFLAASVASINIFGGFLVTSRMIGMFAQGVRR